MGDEELNKFLRPVPRAVAEGLNPQDLKTRKDIWFSSKFEEQILSVAEHFQPTDDLPLPSGFDLIEPANDSEIRSELPKDHVYGASEFCWRLGKMTEAQPNGKAGELLFSGGQWNIFYVIGKGGEVFAVNVTWHGGGRQWNARCSRLVGARQVVSRRPRFLPQLTLRPSGRSAPWNL